MTRPARYLMRSLLTATGGHGLSNSKVKTPEVVRAPTCARAIGQVVLYRHDIKSAAELDPWFAHHRLDRTHCQAAVAFPNAAPATANVTGCWM